MKIRTTTQSMKTQAENVKQEATRFKSLAEEVFTEGRNLDTMWKGDANDTFNSRLRADEPRFYDLVKVIENYCDAIIASANDYDRTEAQAVEAINSNTHRASR